MHTNTRFINVRTGEVVEITRTEGELSVIATVTATGRTVRERTVKTSSLKTRCTNAKGVPYKAAFVAVNALPANHPMAQQEPAESVPDFSTAKVDLAAMSDAELSAYGRQKKAERELAAKLEEDAKTELKRRKPHPDLYIYGDTALSVTTNQRFDGKLAKKVLTSQEYAAILKLKPDAELAREILDEARYKEICKDHGNKIEIRFATQEDRARLAEQQEIEAARAEIEESFYPAGAVETPF